MAHITPDQLRMRFAEVRDLDDDALAPFLESVGTAVDAELGESFAGPATSEVTVSGSGTRYLRVPAFTPPSPDDLPTVTAVDGGAVPAFSVADAAAGLLVTADAAGNPSDWIVWDEGRRFRVEAPFGLYPPADVQEINILVAMAMWREQYAPTASTFRGTVGTSFEWPPRAMRMIERRLTRAALRASF